MLFHYFEKVRPESVIVDVFGNSYGITHHTIGRRGVIPCPPRLVRIHDSLPPCDAGQLLARIGAMGHSIAPTDNLPDDIVLWRVPLATEATGE